MLNSNLLKTGIFRFTFYVDDNLLVLINKILNVINIFYIKQTSFTMKSPYLNQDYAHALTHSRDANLSCTPSYCFSQTALKD